VISAVWLVPLLAVVIALAITWQSYRDRGQLITVTFPDAAGIEIGQTHLRYRDVVVGIVEDMGFTPDLARVNVYIRVNNSIAPYLDDSAAFWIVEPEVTARGITGLNTILSGVYIEGSWDSEPGEPRDAFIGAQRAPIAPPDEDGTTIVLRARESNRLSAGAPILYKGIEVGQLAQPRLTPGGTEVRIDAFVRAPYDRRLSTATRFWDASGVGVNLSGGGVELRIQSLAAVLEGGLVFDTLLSGGEAISDGHVFDVFEDRDAARSDAFAPSDARSIRLSALFPSAAAGLSPGASVRYQGVRVGRVTDITGYVRPDDPAREVQLLAVVEVEPARMGLEAAQDDLAAIDYVGELVAAGLRARLVSTSLLGGELAVELADLGEPGTAVLQVGIVDNPVIPSVPAEIDSFADTAEGVLTRINELPIEGLLAAATDLLGNLNRVVDQDATRALPDAALGVLDEGEALVDLAQGLVRDGRAILSAPQTAATLADVAETAEGLRGLVARLAAEEVLAQIEGTLSAASEAARNVAAGTAGLPELAAQAEAALAGAEALLTGEAAQALPATALAALEAGRDALAAPEIDVILNQAAAAMRDLRDLAGELSGAALGARIDGVLAQAEAAAQSIAQGTADLPALTDSLARAATAAEGILASEDARALPAEARAALASGASALAELEATLSAPEIDALLSDAAATAANLNDLTGQVARAELAVRLDAALAAAETAADNVARGTSDLDALVLSVDRVVSAAQAIVESEDTQALPGAARALLDGGARVIADPAIPGIVADVAATSADLRGIVGQLAAQDAATRLASALEAAETAARAVAQGTEDLPALTDSVARVLAEAETLGAGLNELTEKANALALDRLVDSTAQLMETADAFLSSDEADDVPVVLAQTLEEIRATMATIRTGGTLDNLNATLASASGAAETIRAASAELPELVRRLSSLSNQTGTLLAAYGEGSRVNVAFVQALRAATQAAEDVSALSRSVERNPNSLIFGR
jgi:paraquat-inducible protein B